MTVTPEELELAVGETANLEAKVAPAAADQTVVWSTSDESVATVSDAGVVMAVSAGTATVTATSAGDSSISGSTTVTVSPAFPGDDALTPQKRRSVKLDKEGGQGERHGSDPGRSDLERVYVWVASDSDRVAVGWLEVSSERTELTLPPGVGAGQHKIVVQDESGALVGWAQLSVPERR